MALALVGVVGSGCDGLADDHVGRRASGFFYVPVSVFVIDCQISTIYLISMCIVFINHGTVIIIIKIVYC